MKDLESCVLAFLIHQATDLDNSAAYELVADVLASGDASRLGSYALPFHDDVVHLIPPLPADFQLPNVPLAIEYYKEASRLGKPSAAKKAAALLRHTPPSPPTDQSETGTNTDDDEDTAPEAFKFIRLAVKEDDIEAIKTLASWKWSDAESLKKQRKDKRCGRKDAFRLLLRASKLGDTGSMGIVAAMYAEGLVGPITDDTMIQATKWLEKAARLDDTNAITKVAAIYRQKMLDGPLAIKPMITDEDEEEEDPMTFEDIIERSLVWTNKASGLGDVPSLIALAEAHSKRSSIWDPWKLAFDTRAGVKNYLNAYDYGNTTALIAVISMIYELWEEERYRLLKKYRREAKEAEQDKSTPKASKIKPGDVQMFGDSFDVSSRHVLDMFKQIKQIMKENRMKAVRARCQGHLQDVLKLFMKIEDSMGVTIQCDDSDDDGDESE
jgi:TPR repeat protein